MHSGELLAEKRSKKGHRKIMKQINLIDYIYDAKVTCAQNSVNITAVLAAGSTENLNPALLVDPLENCAQTTHEQLYIVRKKLITKQGENFR